ncbi:hypothetical protein G9A89_015213 [Geosiphon pyriformis]|nr:hypothetical protein G9A89_015213 [Geosiphon pyriformis]
MTASPAQTVLLRSSTKLKERNLTKLSLPTSNTKPPESSSETLNTSFVQAPDFTKESEIQATPMKNTIDKGVASVFLIIFILLVLVGITWFYGRWRRRVRQRRRVEEIKKEIEEEAAWHIPAFIMAEIVIDE